MANKSRDALTGLLSRLGFDELFAKHDGEPIAVAVIDTDAFKSINDRLGHAAGDDLLKAHASSLVGSLPSDALVARHGGDEFLVALPHMSAEGALILLEEVRAYLASHVPTPAVGHPVTISVGIAARPQHAPTLDELLRAANGAMYRAKVEGKDRVAIHVEEKMVMKSNYYDRSALGRLAKLAENVGRTEASLLREALDDLFEKFKDQL